VFALATSAYREGAGTVSGILATAGSISGLAGPWLQGVLLTQHGARAGMAFTLAGALALVVVVVAANRRAPVGPSPHPVLDA
jgi:nitrate/nitrite transporter NarK